MCDVGDTNNDKVGGNADLYVNQHEIFGMNSWEFLGKPSNDGTYNVGTDYSHYIVVLKGPNAFNYVAYKVDPGSSGTYNTTAFGGKDVSHISIYGKDGDTPPPPPEVPLPAAGFLLIAGLSGFALLRRRKA